MDVDLPIDARKPAAVNSEGKIDNGIFYCYYLVVVSYYLTTHIIHLQITALHQIEVGAEVGEVVCH